MEEVKGTLDKMNKNSVSRSLTWHTVITGTAEEWRERKLKRKTTTFKRERERLRERVKGEVKMRRRRLDISWSAKHRQNMKFVYSMYSGGNATSAHLVRDEMRKGVLIAIVCRQMYFADNSACNICKHTMTDV